MLDELIDTLIYERYSITYRDIENMEYGRFQKLINNIISNVKSSKTSEGDKIDILKYIDNNVLANINQT